MPSIGEVVRCDDADAFAHPAERDLARLLTFYGVRWSYEPTTFVLARTEDGPAESFTPDFYLPDHRQYIELTTMRQRLVTRKNRKLRRLRELYPSVGIKLMYRRDYQQLLDAYAHPDATFHDERVGGVLFSASEIAARVESLADQLADDIGPVNSSTPGSGPILVAVGGGSERFHAALTTALATREIDVAPDRIDLTRFSRFGQGRVRVRRGPRLDLRGRWVVLVEDVVSTGLSLAYLTDWLRRRGVADVTACALLDRSGARLVNVTVRHVGFGVSAALLAGFGLTLRRQFSDLPYIAAIEPAIARA